MPEKPPRMQQIEEMLVEDPDDVFLRYALGMEYVSLGDDRTAVEHFRGLMEKDRYVPAYLQAGQALTRLDEIDAAREIFRQGIEAARAQGDVHAEGEMTGFLESID